MVKSKYTRLCIHCGLSFPDHSPSCSVGDSERAFKDDPYFLGKLAEKWSIENGQLWEIGGKHRILCGDSTSAEDVARLVGSLEPGIMVTDPPYGVNYDPGWRQELDASPMRAMGAVMNDTRDDWTEAWELFNGDVAYTWHGGLHIHHVAESMERSGFVLRSLITWTKNHLVMSRSNYHWQTESCWYSVRKGKKAMWAGARDQTTLWSIAGFSVGENNGEAKTGHSTQKPLECMARPIRNHDFEVVYDPFLGSGTTMAAAESLGRICVGMELDPRYVALTLERMKRMRLNIKLLS